MKKSIYISVIALFLLLAVISGAMIYTHFKEATAQNGLYENLATVVEQNTESTKAEPSEAGEPEMLPEYTELYRQNSNIVGWITIPDTKINYPVSEIFVLLKK